jgi:hypothetical protein
LERMQQRYCAVDFTLCGAIARSGEVNCTQVLTRRMPELLRQAQSGCQNQQDDSDESHSIQHACSTNSELRQQINTAI